MTKINISIPQPCHENWEGMTSVEKGKFCNSCQKKVFDFTSSSDREIINAFEKNNNLCGRFLNTQLDHDLIKPKEKSSLWLATATALISLVGLNEVTAQQKAPTEQTEGEFIKGKSIPVKNEVKIEGQIIIEYKNPNYEEVQILVFGKNKIYKPDEHGCFTFYADINDYVIFSKKGFDSRDIKVKELPKFSYIELGLDNCRTMTLGGIYAVKKRNFFGRLFHKNKYR